MKKIILSMALIALPLIAGAINLKATIAGDEVQLRSQMGYHFVGTTHKVPFEVTISADSLLTDFDLSPHFKGIKADVNGTNAKFVIEQPGYYVGSFNDGHHFFLFVDDKDFSAAGIPLSEFGKIDNTGKKDVTELMQSAINAAASKKKTLIVPAGTYLCTQLVLPSNCSLYLEEGSELLLNPTSYRAFRNDAFNRPSFIVCNGKNVKITGLGTINCNGTELFTRHGRKGRLRALYFQDCQKVTVQGITILDGSAWTTEYASSKNVVIQNVKVISNIRILGTDGIDLNGVNNAIVQDCFVCSGDDGICLKSTNSEDNLNSVTVKGNVVMSGSSALKIGTETRAEIMSDVSFVDNDVLLTRWGPHLLIRDGQNLDNILFENNRYENWYYGLNYTFLNKKINPEGAPIDPRTFSITYKKTEAESVGHVVYIYTTKRKDVVEPGDLTNIVLKDNVFEVMPLVDASRIEARDNAKVDVVIKNMVVEGKKINKLSEVPGKVAKANVKVE